MQGLNDWIGANIEFEASKGIKSMNMEDKVLSDHDSQ